MADVLLNPYFMFNNRAREAMEFYQKIFGGELTVQTFGEAMGETSDNKDLVMHARLEADDIQLMASDPPPKGKYVEGTNVSLSLSGTDEARLKKYFEALGQGGTVLEPLKKQAWGDVFGMVDDKFGIHWLVNIAQEA